MKIDFGYGSAFLKQGKSVKVVWDSEKIINGHALIVGKSGMGKTYTLVQMIEQIAEQAKRAGKPFRCHIMDVHGDIEIKGASCVEFSEATKYGINPLLISADPKFGGVRKRVKSFIAAINRSSTKLGSKQEAALRNLLTDLFAANGFYEGDANSWKINDGIKRKREKKNPTMEDAVRYASAKNKALLLGTDNKTISSLEKVYKKKNQIYKKLKAINKEGDAGEIDVLKAEFRKLADECIELFSEHLKNLETGTELTDLMKYDSKDVMKSVLDRLENMNSSGIFDPVPPNFDRYNPIWRYDIKSLSQDEKKLFVTFMLERIFMGAVQRGVQDDLVEIVVLDEAHLFLTDEAENPANMIAKEARKFGLGLFAASQSPDHFSEDFLSNVSTKIILGIDQMFWDGSVRKLKLEQKALEWIVPHKRLIMQINNKGETRNRFLWVTKEVNNG